MSKIEQIKTGPPKPVKPQSRLSELAATRVVSAGEAFDSDLRFQKPEVESIGANKPLNIAKIQAPKISMNSKNAIKRTFRYPKDLDSDLKKFVRRYNLEKQDEDPDLTMEEVGIIMARHFLRSDPKNLAKQSQLIKPKI
jgi:hypothetical protein